MCRLAQFDLVPPSADFVEKRNNATQRIVVRARRRRLLEHAKKEQVAVSIPRPQAQQGRGRSESRGHAAQQQRRKSSGDDDDGGDSDADPDPRRIIPPIPSEIIVSDKKGNKKSVKPLCVQGLGREDFAQEFYAGYYLAVADGKTYVAAIEAAKKHVYRAATFGCKEREKSEKTVASYAYREDTRPRLGLSDPAEIDEDELKRNFDNDFLDNALLSRVRVSDATSEEIEALRLVVHENAGPRRLAELQKEPCADARGQLDFFDAPARRWPSLPVSESRFSRWLKEKTEEIRAAADGDSGEVLV